MRQQSTTTNTHRKTNNNHACTCITPQKKKIPESGGHPPPTDAEKINKEDDKREGTRKVHDVARAKREIHRNNDGETTSDTEHKQGLRQWSLQGLQGLDPAAAMLAGARKARQDEFLQGTHPSESMRQPLMDD